MCSTVCVCQGVEREHVCKALWMCVILGDRVCLGLCMWFNPEGMEEETDVRAGKLSSLLVCHHILISLLAVKSVYTQGSRRVCNYVLLCTHKSAFQWALPCVLKSHVQQCLQCASLPQLVCVCACTCRNDIPTFLLFHRELETKAEGRSC